ncbi:MAG: tetratricopeptide repeat protein [Selenomonadaceae bacterium]|nr:tetratricopeptide repeat protein [Selenomonadaceae bacterium]
MKNYTESLKYFDEAISYNADYFDDFSDPNSHTGDNNIYNMRGQCNEQLQKYEAALKDYEEALIWEPENKKIIKAKQRVEKLLQNKK